jgi:hypothetical protein
VSPQIEGSREMADKNIEPKRPEKDEPAAGARAATRESKRAQKRAQKRNQKRRAKRA